MCPRGILRLFFQLFESPGTRLLHQLKRMRQQEEQEKEASAASRSALEAGTTVEEEEEEENQTSGEGGKGPKRELATTGSLSMPGIRKKPLLEFMDDPIGLGKIVLRHLLRLFKAPLNDLVGLGKIVPGRRQSW